MSHSYSLLRRAVQLTSLGAILVFSPLNAEPTPQGLDQKAKPVLPVEDIRTFVDIWDQIKNAYVEEVSDQKLMENAIRGMLSELDPHSSYLGPKDFEDLQINTTGEFGGLGIEVGAEDGFIKVVSPIDDTPAAKAGVLAGDLIIKLDGTSVKGLSLSEAVAKMRGKPGTSIKLSIMRENQPQPIELEVVRDVIQVKSVRSEMLEPKYGYVRISQFQVHTGEDLTKHLKKIKEVKDLRGIVLDLRNNPGGVLQAAVDVTDAFLDGGLIVYTKGRLESSQVEFEATAGDQANGLPLVVLVNSGSASASEIVAGALKDHERAVIVGSTTFGKGSVQTVIPLAKDKALKLTTARYYTPDGTSIQAQGIKPDIRIGLAKITEIANQGEYRESDLNGHLSNETQAIETAKENGKEAALSKTDYQLFEALNILKALSFAHRRNEDDSNTSDNKTKQPPSDKQSQPK